MYCCIDKLGMIEPYSLQDYVTVRDAAERLSIHPESVRRLIRQGRLPAKKFANAWLVARDVLEQFASHYDSRPGNKSTLF